MKYQDLTVKLNKKEIAPVYLFSGEETYLKEDALRKITEILLPQGNNVEFNYDLIYGDESGAAQAVINRAESLPVLSEKRLVVVKRTEKFKQPDQEKLLVFLTSPSPTTCLIFVASDRVNLKGGFWAALADIGESVVFWHLFDEQVFSWLKYRVKEKGKAISEEAISYLEEAAGNDLMELDNQINKLIIYSGTKKSITLEEVKKLTPDIKVGDVYEMINAIGERKKALSLRILNKLIQEGEEPLKLLSSITYRFRKFMEAQNLLQHKYPPPEINRRLGINTFLDRDFIKQTNNFSKQKIVENFKDILKANIELVKAGKKEAQLILELLILRLCG